ncbi:hypothetical protein QL285_092593 [Trifolium repens]|nr:hypothetical protein QL285_092593 [Trifolium repens]
MCLLSTLNNPAFSLNIQIPSARCRSSRLVVLRGLLLVTMFLTLSEAVSNGGGISPLLVLSFGGGDLCLFLSTSPNHFFFPFCSGFEAFFEWFYGFSVALLLVRWLLLAGSFRSELLVQFAPRRSTAVAGVGFGCCLLVPMIWFYHYFAPVLSF